MVHLAKVVADRTSRVVVALHLVGCVVVDILYKNMAL